MIIRTLFKRWGSRKGSYMNTEDLVNLLRDEARKMEDASPEVSLVLEELADQFVKIIK